LETAAQGASSPEGAARYAALLEAAIRPPMSIPAREITFPLAHPIEGRATMADLSAPVCAAEPDAITLALATAGKPVVLAGHPSIVGNLRACFPRALVPE